MEEGQTVECVWLWLDTERFGCGRRQFIATRGRKWVHVVLISTGETGKLTFDDYARAKQPGPAINPTRARKRLRRNAATFGTETIAVKEALEALK